jgi:hypothetical protein
MGVAIMHHNEAWAGQINTEQAVQIIEAVGNAKAQVAEATMHSEPNMNFWPLLAIAVVPVILAPFIAMWVKRRMKKK